jgi:uncharacterized protein YjbI with pentapeptide repeats
VRDILVALVIGVLLLLWDIAAASNLAQRAERLENLRFVREQSTGNESLLPFQGLDLSGQNLRGLPLNGGLFENAILNQTVFLGANLQSAELTQVVGRGALMAATNLQNANLSFSDFSHADFSEADLNGASAIRTDFTNASFSGQVDNSLTPLVNTTANFTNSDLSHATFTGARLQGVDLRTAKLNHANFSDTDLSNVQLPDSVSSFAVDDPKICYNDGTLWPTNFVVGFPPNCPAE